MIPVQVKCPIILLGRLDCGFDNLESVKYVRDHEYVSHKHLNGNKQIFGKTMKSDFWDCVRNAKKLLVLDLGFLGDTIHLIPALNTLRQALPEVQLDVVAADHIKDILKVCPWVNHVYGYPRYPTSDAFWRDIPRIMRWRSEGYDALVNLNGSDRSGFLSLLSGIPLRLGRTQPKVRWYHKSCYTHLVSATYGTEPVYLQRWRCLKNAGFPGDAPEFNIQLDASVRSHLAAQLPQNTAYLHVSPCATADEKELPLSILAELLNTLQSRMPNSRIVVSCANNARERSKLETLIAQLNFQPTAFAGNLNLLELAALIGGAQLHLGGDSGALHVALMTGVPTLSWFRDYAGKLEWLPPQGKHHTALFGTPSPQGLQGISAANLAEASLSLLDAAD